MGYLIGDVLIASAFLSYTGPFLSNYRDDLVEKQWIAEVGHTMISYLFLTNHSVHTHKLFKASIHKMLWSATYMIGFSRKNIK